MPQSVTPQCVCCTNNIQKATHRTVTNVNTENELRLMCCKKSVRFVVRIDPSDLYVIRILLGR